MSGYTVCPDKEAVGDPWGHLRCDHRYKMKYSSKNHRGHLPDCTSVDECPAVVVEKNRVGDWEADTVIGKNH